MQKCKWLSADRALLLCGKHSHLRTTCVCRHDRSWLQRKSWICGLLICDTVQHCGRTATFRRDMLRQSSGLNWIGQSQSDVMTDGLSGSSSRCRAPSGAHDQILIIGWQLRICRCGAPSLTRGWVSQLSIWLVTGSTTKESEFESRGARNFTSPCPDRLWGPRSLLSNGYWGALFPGREADHSRPTTAEVKKTWVYIRTSNPPYAFMA
jgi:hypothetical protein